MTQNLMGVSLPQLRRWSAQQLLDHRHLNEPVDALDDLTRGVPAPRQAVAVPRGGGAAAATAIAGLFRLTQEAGLFPDHLVCRTWDGETEGDTDVLIAKPWLLRRTPFDEQVREGVLYEYDDGVRRTAFDDADVTRQLKRVEQIQPRYLIGDELNGLPAVTGIAVDGVDDDGEPIVIPVTLLDVNADSRGWKTYYEWL